ncbi:HAD-IIIA family hydrolase [Gloeobacter kilaueensis]|nr:HAD-IIIA family hydrolase [Gloeobacter kilaueensis]
MLILFDLDGTLITSYMERPDRQYHRWQVLPNRRALLAQLRAEDHQLGIATNQGGVGLGFITQAAFYRKLGLVLEALELPCDLPVAVCFAHPQARRKEYRSPDALARRKPNPGMLLELAQNFSEAAAGGVLYVGDKPEDRQAARAAGADFAWAEDFFDQE